MLVKLTQGKERIKCYVGILTTTTILLVMFFSMPSGKSATKNKSLHPEAAEALRPNTIKYHIVLQIQNFSLHYFKLHLDFFQS
jgi:hypothetical protein